MSLKITLTNFAFFLLSSIGILYISFLIGQIYSDYHSGLNISEEYLDEYFDMDWDESYVASQEFQTDIYPKGEKFEYPMTERREIFLTIESTFPLNYSSFYVKIYSADGKPREYKSINKVKLAGKVLFIDIDLIGGPNQFNISFHTLKKKTNESKVRTQNLVRMASNNLSLLSILSIILLEKKSLATKVILCNLLLINLIDMIMFDKFQNDSEFIERISKKLLF